MLFFDKDQAQERQEEALADVLGQALRYTAVGAGIVAGLAMFLRRWNLLIGADIPKRETKMMGWRIWMTAICADWCHSNHWYTCQAVLWGRNMDVLQALCIYVLQAVQNWNHLVVIMQWNAVKDAMLRWYMPFLVSALYNLLSRPLCSSPIIIKNKKRKKIKKMKKKTIIYFYYHSLVVSYLTSFRFIVFKSVVKE